MYNSEITKIITLLTSILNDKLSTEKEKRAAKGIMALIENMLVNLNDIARLLNNSSKI